MTSIPVGPARANWLVLAPSPAGEAWKAAIEQALAKAGLKAVFLSPGERPDDLRAVATVFVTSDAAQAMAARPRYVTAIIPDLAGMAGATAAEYKVSPYKGMQTAFSLLARISGLPSGQRIFGPAEIREKPRFLKVLPDVWVAPPEASSATQALSPLEAAASGALSIFDAGRPAVGASGLWARQLFLYDNRAAAEAVDVGHLDTTGRPRILVYGPYAALPAGLWRATLRFGVDGPAARHQFRIDWGGQTEFTSATVLPGRSGVFEIALEYLWAGPQPAELRVLLMEGSIDGEFRFLQAEITLADQAG